MSAAGRLWRRAPAWRFCLVSALGLAALTALFPPAGLKHLGADVASGLSPAGRTPAAAPASARFVPPGDSLPDAPLAATAPPPGPGRTGSIPFAGRQLPLPPGEWQTLIVARTGTPDYLQTSSLARIDAGQVTGVVRAVASDPLSHAVLPPGRQAECYNPSVIASNVSPRTPEQSPEVIECWTVSRFKPPAAAEGRQKLDGPLAIDFERLDSLGVHLPSEMLAMTYLRADETGWLDVVAMTPDKSADAERKMLAFARQYAGELHRGFSADK